MRRTASLIVPLLVALLASACGSPGGGGQTGGNTTGGGGSGKLVEVTPSKFDVRTLDVCKSVPKEQVVKILGHDLTKAPVAYSVEDRDVGCYYEAGKDASSKLLFAYLTIGPTIMYLGNRELRTQLLTDTGLGDEVYTRRGSNSAIEVWVLINGKGALIAGVGQTPNLDIAKKLIPLLTPLLPK